MDVPNPNGRDCVSSARKVRRRKARSAGRTLPAINDCLRPVVETLEVRQLMSVPNGPFALSATATAPTQASLAWYDSATDATGYRVMRQGADGHWQSIATLGGNATTFTDTTLPAGAQVSYSVTAFNYSGDSSTTSAGPIGSSTTSGSTTTVTSVASANTVPDGPFALTANAQPASQVSLVWHDSAKSNVTGYRVIRQGPDGSWSTVGTLGASATSFTDSSAAPATQYTYAICAYNAIGDSSFTNNGTITTTGTPIPTAAATTGSGATTTTPVGTAVPNGPFGLNTVAASATQVNLAWHDAHSNETGYKIERQAGNGSYTLVATLSADATTYTDTTVVASTQYTYHIYAYNSSGVSSTAVGTVTTPSSGGVLSSSGTSSSPAGYFPVGVFYQPTYSFAKWSSLGVNLVYGYEKGAGDSMAQWDAAAASAGFKEIRQASSNPASDTSVKNLMAWLQPQDEPESNGVSAATLAAQYATLKAANPNIPVITTYSGGTVIGWQGSTSTAAYQQYLANTDWVGADIYPVTGWNLPGKLNAVGQVVDKLTTLAPGKKDFAFIETSNQQLPWVPNDRGATPDEMRAEIWDAIIHGAGGIVYFPQQIGSGFQYDATPANVAAEMATQDAKLQQYGAALNSTANPSGVSATGAGSLEVTTRVYGGHTYFFVLNLSSQSVTGQAIKINGLSPNTTLTVDGENRTVQVNATALTDNFSPYSLHIYVA